jgi:hypothetical protein
MIFSQDKTIKHPEYQIIVTRTSIIIRRTNEPSWPIRYCKKYERVNL